MANSLFPLTPDLRHILLIVIELGFYLFKNEAAEDQWRTGRKLLFLLGGESELLPVLGRRSSRRKGGDSLHDRLPHIYPLQQLTMDVRNRV